MAAPRYYRHEDLDEGFINLSIFTEQEGCQPTITVIRTNLEDKTEVIILPCEESESVIAEESEIITETDYLDELNHYGVNCEMNRIGKTPVHLPPPVRND